MLWDLIWNENDCQFKRKQLKWDAKNLKQFFKKLFFFSEVFPKRFYKEYEKDMKTFDWRMKRGIKSLAKDADWDDAKVKELDENFYQKIEHYFEFSILETIFG